MMTKINHLYLHVPFCHTICSYCDFCHVIYQKELCDTWLSRIEDDLSKINNKDFETIYIGGGTPNSLNLTQLDKLLSLLDPYINKVTEYTIELNPEDINQSSIDVLIKHHINRVSVGLQSSDYRLLKMMNRHYTFSEFKEKINILKANNITNISIDIIYSLPSQTMDDLNKTLNDVLELDVPHISLYSLTIEPNTIFAKLGYNHLDDEIEADMYERIRNFLINNGYKQYEVSNFCKEGYESKHNLGYWNYDDFIGIGAGSSSKINHRRYTITKNINNYLNRKELYSEDINLTLSDEMFENVMMSLRTNRGLNLKLFKKRYHKDFKDVYQKAIEKNQNNLVFKGDYCLCNNLAILNHILIDFLD